MKNVKLKLSKNFYGVKELEKTKKAFVDVCGCEIKEQKDYFDVYLVPKEKGENLELEFANYVLALMK